MLNAFGKLAIAEIIFYAPILLASFFVTLRYGFRRGEGWIALFIFSSVRSLAAILSIVSQSQSNPSSGILTAVDILQALGLSPLLEATLGFTTAIAEFGLPQYQRVLRLLRIVLMTGVVLAIIGGTKLSPSNSPSSQASGHTLSKVGTLCFLASYLALCGLNILLWAVTEEIPPNHRKLLRSLSISLPFLAVRVLYSLLNAFAKSPSKWSPITGEWQIYLVMALIMEYIVVTTYIITGALVPLHKEDKRNHVISSTTSSDVEHHAMVAQKDTFAY